MSPSIDTRLPVTLLSGFLGSGKTTLLEHILRSKDHNLKCAIIVNDMATLNIDADLISSHQIVQKEEKLVQMQNGCICCTLREDLLEEICKLAEKGKFDYLIIESTGISEPIQVAETFSAEFLTETLEMNKQHDIKSSDVMLKLLKTGGISDVARLDTCVTVVDCCNFFSCFETADFLADRYEDAEEGDERTISDLMVDQIEFANVILLNKTDLVSPADLCRIEALVRKLNAGAKIIKTRYSKVDLNEIINTNLFSFDEAMANAGWLKSLHESLIQRDGKMIPKPETEEYGVSTFVYTQRRPFNDDRLFEVLGDKLFIIQEEEQDEEDEEMEYEGEEEVEEDVEEDIEEESDNGEDEPAMNSEEIKTRIAKKKDCDILGPLVRSKGTLWLASNREKYFEWSQAGCILTIKPGAEWFCELPRENWPEDPESVAAILYDFKNLEDPNWKWGDRRQEIVMIGCEMNADKLRKLLDGCLLTDEEMSAWENCGNVEDLGGR